MSETLESIALAMVATGKGILAADESSGTIKKRFDAINVESTEDNRRDYREMMFRTTNAMTNHISGVILFDETIRQKGADGTPLVDVIKAAGALPGIKVDGGAKDLAGAPGEMITEGLDGLRDRFAEYYKIGARFAKWRAVINIGENIPSPYCISTNVHALARYAKLAQEAGIVPIVEPEVIMDGSHSIERCEEVTETTLIALFDALREQNVNLEGCILKPNMVISGSTASNRAGVQEVAERTLKVLKRTVPAAIPGIVFLSGGQSDVEATAHLGAMNKMGPLPWKLSFSYGRALQAAPQKAWAGKADNVPAAQAAFAHRAKMNSLASKGEYSSDLEK